MIVVFMIGKNLLSQFSEKYKEKVALLNLFCWWQQKWAHRFLYAPNNLLVE